MGIHKFDAAIIKMHYTRNDIFITSRPTYIICPNPVALHIKVTLHILTSTTSVPVS